MQAGRSEIPPFNKMNVAKVKQVQSGDTVVLQSFSKQGPPKERTLSFSNVTAPKLSRRPTTAPESPDQVYAWEAREFLRKKLVGKKVYFTVDTPAPSGGREYGTIYIGPESDLENLTEILVYEGYVDVRSSNKPSEIQIRLNELAEKAKEQKKGKHNPNNQECIRKIVWTVENPRNFVDQLKYKPVDGVVEHVRDGSTIRVLLLDTSPNSEGKELMPSNEMTYITLMISGIRCPACREDFPEPFGEEAKFFTESRLLQRDIKVILESVSNNNFIGTVVHPNGNIAELLLAEGLAKCVDWSLQCVTGGSEKLRAAEKSAKEKRLRLWKDYSPSGPVIDAKEKEFQGKVLEVSNADALLLKLNDGSQKKIFLASIRPPRLPDSVDSSKTRVRPLYDIPYMFEAREFLRKKLVGKRVNVTVDYIQPANNNFPEKTCCTVTIGGINVAEALVSKGFATVIRYKQDDDQRSAHYDELLSAETKAAKAGKGLHSKKEAPVHRVVDLSGDLQKSKQFFPFLQRAGKMEAVVEFVFSGSRLRVFVPRENCVITFLLGGISCARASRDTKAGLVTGDPFGDEALAYTKELCMQKEVQIEVDSMDKAGNVIGWLWIENLNLSELLVKEGFAEVHSTAARSAYSRQLHAAQEEARNKKLKMWESYVPDDKENIKDEDETDRVIQPKKIKVTVVRKPELVFYAFLEDDEPKLEELRKKLSQEFVENPPLNGSYTPRKGDVCAAIYSEDQQWYRAKVDKIQGNQVQVTFIDYGNKEATNAGNLARLPSTFSVPPFAKEYSLAFIKVSQDQENMNDAFDALVDAIMDKVLFMNFEYKIGSLSYVTLTTEKGEDIGKELVKNGFLLVDRIKGKKFQKTISEYLSAQESAKQNRLNLWQYGDVTEDDAKEFG